jgi:hypothetical protein
VASGTRLQPWTRCALAYRGGDLRIAWRIVDGGQRRSQVDSVHHRLVLGAEGVFAGWDYKAGFENDDRGQRDQQFPLWPVFRHAAARSPEEPALCNPFGPNDAAGLAELKKAELTGTERWSSTSNTGVDVQFSKELFKFGSGMAAVAFGAEMRKEKVQRRLLRAGIFRRHRRGLAATRRRHRRASTRTASSPSYALPLMKGLDLTAAVRHRKQLQEHLGRVARRQVHVLPTPSATSPKVSVRVQPTRSRSWCVPPTARASACAAAGQPVCAEPASPTPVASGRTRSTTRRSAAPRCRTRTAGDARGSDVLNEPNPALEAGEVRPAVHRPRCSSPCAT